MGRIGEGAVPRQSTLEKYNILPAEVDAARAAVGLDPLYEDNNYQSTTVLENINEATRREISEVARQQRLIVELEQNQDKLRELQIGAEQENEGRIVRVPAAKLYNVHVVKQYLWKNDDRKRSEKTKAVAYGPKPTPEKQNARAGQLYQTFWWVSNIKSNSPGPVWPQTFQSHSRFSNCQFRMIYLRSSRVHL